VGRRDVPLVLLPPSEGKAPGGDGRWRPGGGTFRALAEARRQVIDAYASALVADDITKLVGATGTLAERARAAGLALAAGRATSLPAHRRFTGVVWEHLDPATLGPAERSRIGVVSALCGLVTGEDPVPDHRLKLSVSVPGLGRLDRWWRPHVTATVKRWAGRRAVWDLLPAEHAAAVDLTAIKRVTRVRFLDATDQRVVGHDAKAVKGAFARQLLLHGPDAVGAFDQWGWRAGWDGDDVVVTR
jgi:cytoplasmic iron level regulating protein YaaA (DUF328/UPF0246 family)